jgi:hypothetical protein
MPNHKPQFSINRTEEFVQKCHELSKVYGRLTDLINSVDWALARKPHTFNKISGDYYLLKTSMLSNPEFPKLIIVYRILEADNKVVLLDIDDEVD